MDLNTLHDVLLNQIIPILYKTNTNPTVLIFMTVSKRTNKKLSDLTYILFNCQDPTLIQHMTSCDITNGVVFPYHDKRLFDLKCRCIDEIPIPKLLLHPTEWSIERIEDVIITHYDDKDMYSDQSYYRLLWAWRYTESIYGYYCASLPLILDESLQFKHRIDLIEEYIHPLSDFFESLYTSMTFYKAMAKAGIVDRELAERLEPYIDNIIESWLWCCDCNVVTMISIARYIDGFDVLFRRLNKQVLEGWEKETYTFKVYKLILVCLELDENQTLVYLGAYSIEPFFNSTTSRFRIRSSHTLDWRIYTMHYKPDTCHSNNYVVKNYLDLYSMF